MTVKKFRNIVETDYESLFDDENVLNYLSEKVKFSQPNSFRKFLIKFNAFIFYPSLLLFAFFIVSVFFIIVSLELPIVILWVILIVIFGLIAFLTFWINRNTKLRIHQEIRKNINVAEVYKLILDKVENVDIYSINSSNDIANYLWNYSNVVSSKVTMNFPNKTTTFSRGKNEKIYKLSNVINGKFNGKRFRVGIATWKYETSDGKNTTVHYRDSCILFIDGQSAIIDTPVFINDNQSGIGKIDKLENLDFNKDYVVNTLEPLFSRKVFTIYTQELWVKLRSLGIKKMKAGIYKDEYVQIVTGKNIDQNLFQIDVKKFKTITREAILKSILKDVKSDLKMLLLLLSYFGTSEVMNK